MKTRPAENAPALAPFSSGSDNAGRISGFLARSGVRQGLLSILDQAIVSATSFATSVFVGRLLSQNELGIYALAISIIFFAQAVQSELVCAPYMVYWHRRRGTALASYGGSALVHQFALSAMMMLAMLGVAGLIAAGIGPSDLAPVIWAIIGFVPFLLMRSFIRSFESSHLAFRRVVLFDAAVAAVHFAGLGGLAWAGYLNVPAVCAVMGLSSAAGCAAWWFWRDRPISFRRGRLLPDWRENWRFGKWALASSLTGSGISCLMPWIIALAVDARATGLLAACVTVVNLIGMWITGISNFLTPKAATAFAHGGIAALNRVLAWTGLVFGTTVGGFFVFVLATGDWLATFLYGGEFAGTGLILALLAANMLVNSAGITVGNGLWALDRPRANFAADICIFVATLTCLAALIVPLGVTGAAIALLVGTTIGTAARCYAFYRLAAQFQPAVPAAEYEATVAAGTADRAADR